LSRVVLYPMIPRLTTSASSSKVEKEQDLVAFSKVLIGLFVQKSWPIL
jgi:hypothetical protein